MNQEILDKLRHRAIIINNIDGLNSYGLSFNKNKQQLSLFGDAVESKISLVESNDINYGELIEKEKDSLGVYLTYNPFDEFILVNKKYCNNTIESLLDVANDCKKGIILLARIIEVKYKKSAAGNSYAKVIIGDSTGNYMVYLWGKDYSKLIKDIFKDQIYLIELGFIKDGNTFFVVNIKEARNIDIEKYVKEICLQIEDPENIPIVREYIFSNMIGSQYSLSFIHNGEKYDAPYRINFTSDDYYYLKDYITNLKI